MFNRQRKKIDKIDDKIVRLLNKRAKIALEIGKEKRDRKMNIEDPEREEEVIKSIKQESDGPLGEKSIENIFNAIIGEMKRIEEEVNNHDCGNET